MRETSLARHAHADAIAKETQRPGRPPRVGPAEAFERHLRYALVLDPST